MYSSLLRTPGDWFADFEQLQDRIDELLGGRAATSSIRAVGRAGAFPALNVGTWAEALEIYAFAPGIDPKSIEVSVEKGLLSIAGERPRRATPPLRASRRRKTATSTRRSASADASVASSPCPRTPTDPRRGQLSQRRAEDRRAEARIVEAAPDPGRDGS
jgi:HSP20 family molecular chaperone IbpA